MAKGYTTESQIENFLGISIPTGEADFYIEAAENFIDQYCDRNFKADTVASERVYDGEGGDLLNIDECIEITEVKRGLSIYGDSTETLSPDVAGGYYKLPNNYSVKNLAIDCLHLRDKTWLSGFQNHKVTAKWGFSENPPDAVEMACTILASGYYHFNKGGASGNVSSERIGNYQVSYPTKSANDLYKRVYQLLSPYKRFSL